MMVARWMLALIIVGLVARSATAQECLGDADGDGVVTTSDILTVVNNALNGCPEEAVDQKTCEQICEPHGGLVSRDGSLCLCGDGMGAYIDPPRVN